MKLLIFRTILIYLCVLFAMRLMGKRQLGELQPHGKQNAEIQNNSAAKQQFHAQTLPVRCARRIPLRQSGHTAHTKE